MKAGNVLVSGMLIIAWITASPIASARSLWRA